MGDLGLRLKAFEGIVGQQLTVLLRIAQQGETTSLGVQDAASEVESVAVSVAEPETVEPDPVQIPYLCRRVGQHGQAACRCPGEGCGLDSAARVFHGAGQERVCVW